LKTKIVISLLFINMLYSAELKIADDFKDGDVLSASVFNQIFDSIERVSGTIKDSDLLGVWNCNAISSNSSSGWIQDGFFFKVNDAQVNLSASSSSKSLENPYSISTSNPNPFNWANTTAFIGKYVLLNNHLIIKRDSDSEAKVWDLDLVSKSRFELTYADTASQYANFIFCDSATAVPAAPTGPTAINNKTSILLSWTDSSSDESGFKVYRKKTGDGDFQLVSTQAATSYSDTTLSEGEKANYYIKSYNQNGDSNQSNVVVATLDSIPPRIISTTPANGTNSSGSLVTINFSEPVNVLSCPPEHLSGFGILCAINDSAITFVGTGGSGNTYAMNCPQGVSTCSSNPFVDGANTNYAVKIDKRFVYDLNGNVMESDFSFSFTDN
jgi:hypothetical protein